MTFKVDVKSSSWFLAGNFHVVQNTMEDIWPKIAELFSMFFLNLLAVGMLDYWAEIFLRLRREGVWRRGRLLFRPPTPKPGCRVTVTRTYLPHLLLRVEATKNCFRFHTIWYHHEWGGWGGGGTPLRGSDIVIHLHSFNKRFCLAVVKFKKVQNHFALKVCTLQGDLGHW